MLEIFFAAFATLFVVMDPLGIAPIFAVMTEGAPQSHKRRMIYKSSLTALIILLAFAFAGDVMMNALGISMPAFRTAGGFMLFLIAMDMVFEKRTERREKKAQHNPTYDEVEEVTPPEESDEDYEDISVFPLAIPFISGPGTIATVMLLMGQQGDSYEGQAVILAALLATLISTIIILFLTGRIMSFLGPTVASAITRILGVILAAMAVQYMFDGIKNTFFV